MSQLKVSVTRASGTDANVARMRVTFYEGDDPLHSLTVLLSRPGDYDGSIGLNHGALKQVQQFLPELCAEMQKVLTEAVKSENTSSARRDRQTETAVAVARPTILIVDDYDEYRTALRMYLERSGYDVVEAEDGQQAVEVAHASLPAVILMDIGLPKWGGVAAIRDIRSDKKLRECPVVVVTAYDTPGMRLEALEAGANEVLAKPVDFDLLISVLEQFTKVV